MFLGVVNLQRYYDVILIRKVCWSVLYSLSIVEHE